MQGSVKNVSPSFLSGGEMSSRISAFDWSGTGASKQDHWSPALRTAVALLLSSGFPMALWWGTDLLQFYNDAFKSVLGRKHPAALGQKAQECWTEIWESIQPLLQSVQTTGEGAWIENILIPIHRQDTPEDTYWDISLSPVPDDAGNIGGIMVHCIEMTAKLNAYEELKEKKDHLEFAIETSELATWDLNPITNTFTANQRYTEWFGLTAAQATDNNLALQVIAEEDRDRVIKAYTTALNQSSGASYDIEYTIRPNGLPERMLRAKGKAWFDREGTAYRFNGTLQDITEENERKKQLHYRTALMEAHNQSNLDGVLLVDAKGKIISFNQRFVEIWNMPQAIVDANDDEAALSFAMTQLVNPHQFIEKVKYLYDHPTQTSIDHLEYKDGRIIERYGYPVVAADGTFYAWSWTFRDITEQEKGEQALRESEHRFRTLADQSPMIVYLVEPDEKATISYFNKTWLDYTGQTFQQAIGRAWDGIVHPDDVQGVMDIYLPAFQKQESYTLPAVRLKRYDGEYKWHLFKGNPRYLTSGEFVGFVGVGIDIDQQKLAADKISEKEERFRTLADSISQLAWTADGDGWIYWYNQRWYDYTGTTLEEMQGWGWQKVHHPDHVDRIVAFTKAAWHIPEPFELTFPLRSAKGEYRWFLTRAYPIKNGDGKIIQWIGTNTDIHDQKTSEEKLEELVAHRTIELQRSNEDLLQFAHVASHDLKEPVRKVKTFASRLEEELEDILSERSRTYLDKIFSAADRMFSMIDGVLTYSSLNASEQQPVSVDLNNVLSNIKTDVEVSISQKDAQIKYANLPNIEGAPVLIYQLFYNLINNSLKFSKTGIETIIEITAKETELHGRPATQLTVRDNGIGFDQHQAQKIFESFARLHSKDQYEGTGLGLSLCKKIVERHQGTITATGLLNEGATFVITLPLTQERVMDTLDKQ